MHDAPERSERPGAPDRQECGHGLDLAGRYRVGSLVRTDGRCCVHEGRDVLLQRRVSVTLATPERGIPIPTTLALPTSARHGHGPGLHEIYDGGDDHGTLYLITQAPEGATLADELNRHHLTADEVRDLGAGIARALLPAHRRGWAHGALEADTVGLGPERVTVAGLGVGEWLAHWAQVEDRPRYPAPEQLAEGEISPATDVFALGALLTEAAEPLPPTDPLSVLLHRMRADDPAERPSTDEVLHFLRVPDGTPLPPSGEPRAVVVRRRGPGTRAAPTITALGGLAVAAALALATFLVHTSDASSERVVGGATVAASSAGPVLPGPLPLLIPPLARGERTHAAPAATLVADDRKDDAPVSRSATPASTRTAREDRTARAARVAVTSTAASRSADTGSADPTTTTTPHSSRTPRSSSPRPRATNDPSDPGRAGRTATTTPVTDDGTGDPTATHRTGSAGHRRAGIPVVGRILDPTGTRTSTSSVTPTSDRDQDEATH